METEEEGNHYLRIEYSNELNEYKYYIILPQGTESFLFSHIKTLENPDNDFNNKLMESFQKYGISNLPGELIEIPHSKTDIKLHLHLSQLKDLGRKILLSFDGDVTNRAILLFDELHPGNGKNIFLGWLSMLSSVMGNPIILIVKGDPGTGKTQITEIIKEFIPERHIIELNNATESSLFTKAYTQGENYPDKKIFYLKDLGDKNAMVNTAPYRKHLRELASDGRTSREISDTQKSGDGPREMFHEHLEGYPTMMYSTVRDGEIEQQETDRAIEITPSLLKIKKIKEIILFHDSKTAKITNKLITLKKDWIPKFHGIFEYIIDSPKEVLLPWDLTDEKYGLRDTKTIVSLTKKLAMINQHTRDKIEDYIIASPVDLELALRYVQDGGLERTRLQQVYEEYGLSHSFTREDVVALFPDSYDGAQASKSAYRYILKPATEDFDSDGTPLLDEIKEIKPYTYFFRRQPSNNVNFKIPKRDYSLLKKNYPNLPWGEHH